ncbi:hypothetical protein [Streptomyces sp. NPDC126514]|uniref:hypothetical protein n=1 Tax=Streptomyces sp. NPDC126514 TaxID=3155210 RepID=UPI0033188655
MRKTKSLLAAAGVLAAASVLPVVTAGTAHASAATCRSYLAQWYTVGPKVTAACNFDGPLTWPSPFCINALIALDVLPSRAQTACSKASN